MSDAPPADGRGEFLIARRLFAAALGAVFLVAFISLGVQARGLYGSRGIVPAETFLKSAHEQLGASAYAEVPSLFWLHVSDGALVGACVAGAVLSALMIAGVSSGACAFVCWALYLSLCAVGSPFLNFQWDALLLETAFLAIFFLPWHWRPEWRRSSLVSHAARLLLWWLLFRLMFESGVVKFTSGDKTWRDLTALDYHFETQPLPLWTAWFIHQAPGWFLKGAVVGNYAIELLVPFFFFAPRRLRHIAALTQIALQFTLIATGNYAYFNWLTIALCLPLLDDRCWPARLVRVFAPARKPDAPPRASPRWPLWLFAPVAAVSLAVTAVPLIGAFNFRGPWPRPVAWLNETFGPLRSFNGYGLFRVMTTERPEIVVEGSSDGVNWHAYEFKWKPGNLHQRPRLVAPHQPRLDWQMWFAALGDVRQNPWFVHFLVRLLEASPDVTALLAWNPFPNEPPRYVRAVLYDYHFTRSADGGSAWWKRERRGLYCPPISFREK